MPCANTCYKKRPCSSAKKLAKKEIIENVFLSTGDDRCMYNHYLHPDNLYTLDEDREKKMLIDSKKLSKRILRYHRDKLEVTAYRVGNQLLHHVACINNPQYVYPTKQLDQWGYSLVDDNTIYKTQWEEYVSSSALDTMMDQICETMPHHIKIKNDFKAFVSKIMFPGSKGTCSFDKYYSILPEETYLGAKILVEASSLEKLENTNLKELLNSYKDFASTLLGMWRLQKLGAKLISHVVKAYVGSLHVGDPSVYGIRKDGSINVQEKELLPLFKELCKKLLMNVKLKSLTQCLQIHYDESFKHGPKYDEELSVCGIKQQYRLAKFANLIDDDTEKKASWMAVLLNKCDILDVWVKEMNTKASRFKGDYLPRWKYV